MPSVIVPPFEHCRSTFAAATVHCTHGNIYVCTHALPITGSQTDGSGRAGQPTTRNMRYFAVCGTWASKPAHSQLFHFSVFSFTKCVCFTRPENLWASHARTCSIMRFDSTVGLHCLLILDLVSIASSQSAPVVNRLFTVSDTCSDVQGQFTESSHMLWEARRKVPGLELSQDEITAGQQAGLAIENIRKTVHRGTELAMKHAHIATGINSFDMYGRKRG